MQKLLILIGIVLILIGIIWPIVSQIPLGRLPGDIVIKRPSFTLYFPLVTSLILSLILSLIWYLIRK